MRGYEIQTMMMMMVMDCLPLNLGTYPVCLFVDCLPLKPGTLFLRIRYSLHHSFGSGASLPPFKEIFLNFCHLFVYQLF